MAILPGELRFRSVLGLVGPVSECCSVYHAQRLAFKGTALGLAGLGSIFLNEVRW